MFKFFFLISALVGSMGFDNSLSASPDLRIAIIGDSTVCDYPKGRLQHGWGQVLPAFFLPTVSFLNAAAGGRSSKSFEPERWQKVLAFKPDYILIQFGHNDAHAKARPESTDAGTDFKDNLQRYIVEARAAGAIPILITPPHPRVFDRSGKVSQGLLPYARSMKEVGREMEVPVADLYARTEVLFESLGEEKSTPYTMNEINETGRLPDPATGKISADRTHFTEIGARALAEIIAGDLADIDPRLKGVLKESPKP